MALKESGLRGSLRNVSVGVGALIPDSGNLHSHWDATELSGVSTFTDQQGNNDLSAVGDPQLESSGINGKQTVLYDGTDDLHETTNWDTDIQSPRTVYIVYQLLSVDDSANEELFSGQGDSGTYLFRAADNGQYEVFNDMTISGGDPDTNTHLAANVLDTNGVIEIDDSQVASGDAGTTNQAAGNSFWLGGIGEFSRYANVRIGEVAYYSVGHDDATRSEFYNYANDKWGV